MTDTIYLAQKSIEELGTIEPPFSAKDLAFVILAIINIIILYFNIEAIKKSPTDAVKVGRDLNTEQQKDNAKRYLFLTLFSLRGDPLNYEFVKGLNQIEIVFEDENKVLVAWKVLRDSLNSKLVNPDKTWALLRTNLLSDMAISLGYNQINQTDFLENYYPEGHHSQLQIESEFLADQHNYYKTASKLNQLLYDLNYSNPDENLDVS